MVGAAAGIVLVVPGVARAGEPFVPFYKPSPAVQPGGIVPLSDGNVLAAETRHGVQSPMDDAVISLLSPTAKILRQYRATPAPGATRAAFYSIRVRDGVIYAPEILGERFLAISMRTGRVSTLATFPNLPDCGPTAVLTAGQPPYPRCSPSTLDLTAEPLSFDLLPDGSALVADEQQALIWRIPAGGGTPQVWYSDARFDGYFGISDIQILPGARAVDIVVDQPNEAVLAGVWRIDLNAHQQPTGPATPFWISRPGDAPLDAALASDGTLFVSQTVGNQVVALDTTGKEIDRWPTLVANQQQQVPVDGPTNLALAGTTLYLSNTAFLSVGEIQTSHLAVLESPVTHHSGPLPADDGLPAPTTTRPTTTGSPAAGVAGRTTTTATSATSDASSLAMTGGLPGAGLAALLVATGAGALLIRRRISPVHRRSTDSRR